MHWRHRGSPCRLECSNPDRRWHTWPSRPGRRQGKARVPARRSAGQRPEQALRTPRKCLLRLRGKLLRGKLPTRAEQPANSWNTPTTIASASRFEQTIVARLPKGYTRKLSTDNADDLWKSAAFDARRDCRQAGTKSVSLSFARPGRISSVLDVETFLGYEKSRQQ